MRVLLVIGRVTGGGAERQWMLVARGLLDAGHRVTLATLDPEGTPEVERLVARGLTWRPVSGGAFSGGAGRPLRRGLGLALAVARLRLLVAREQPDVVYSALTVTNAAAWCATRLGHGHKLVWGFRGEADYVRFARLIEGVVGAMARTVPLGIANAARSVEFYRRRGVSPVAWEVVPNGFDTDEFRPDAAKRAQVRASWGVDDEPVVGCVARLTPVKEHPLLLRAFARVLACAPRALLVLAGDGPAGAEARLRELARGLGITERVRFLGLVDDAASVCAGLDVHVLTSSAEGFPNAIGEAMAAGVPCVATDVGAVASLIGETGFVVPSGDEVALAEALTGLLGTPALRARLGEAARQRVIDEFSLAATAARTLAAFARAL